MPEKTVLYDIRCADRRAQNKRAGAKKATRTIEGHAMREAVIESLLVAHYSPEQIAGTFHVSTHTTIYAWVERTRPDLKRCLRRRGKRRRKYGCA